ncbi:unnamed protein product [Caenorhabditis auriculariae]|uniref:RING-CH-type domain-containing protein n=1 Tax=Caenorhabditis auriculariae TaxID=2777116 RepID=A0A8S1HLD2_9PELO|nr:unnamed protein product [Caenorhabditis auriculariae]
MHASNSDFGIRRTGIICSKTGETLGTIEEESQPSSMRESMRHGESVETTPKKSATFHNVLDLRRSGARQLSADHEYQNLTRLHSQPSTSSGQRKRSIFTEMGERIRLFSTASFVSPASPSASHLPKAQSLNSFDDTAAFVPARCPSRKSRRSSRRPIGSLASLHSQVSGMSVDVEKCEKDVSSQLGMLCHHCSTADLTCPKTQKELRSPSVPSLYSLAQSDVSGEALCRICHCCWPPDSNDPLISPCRCSGSLQYVHVSCLMHWLDISSRKLHRPAVCELCLYKYRRRRVLKYREMKLPQCADRDVRYYTIFVFAIIMMFLSAFATIACFQIEKSNASRMNSTTVPAPLSILATSSPGAVAPAAVNDSRKRPHDIITSSSEPRTTGGDEGGLLSTITLVAAMVFFLSFFLAMYAHVKSGLSFCSYLTLCWSSNLEWSIEEYKHSRDTQYSNKLEELRRKINEKQKKRQKRWNLCEAL